MRNLVLSLLVLGMGLALVTSSCKKEDDCLPTDCVCNNNCPPPDTLDFELSALTDSVQGLKTDAELIAKVHFTNTSNTDTTKVKWEVVSQTIPTDWDRAICDNEQCWSPAMSSREMTLLKTQDFEFKMNFYPNSVKGNGTVTIKMYAVEDSAATAKTVVFYGNAL